jgi:hypothetical protein
VNLIMPPEVEDLSARSFAIIQQFILVILKLSTRSSATMPISCWPMMVEILSPRCCV